MQNSNKVNMVTYYPPGVWFTRPESSQGKYSALVEPQREPRSKPDFLLTTSVIWKGTNYEWEWSYFISYSYCR